MSREIDELIAEKVMGWKLETIATSTYGSKADVWKNETGKIMVYDREWKPTSDISSAWRVVEKIQEKGYFEMTGWPGDYHVNFADKDGHGFSGQASTAPLAICLAAITALKFQQKSELTQ